jgi:prepilin-type N-terminal cleavage/methylation domain-containing protein
MHSPRLSNRSGFTILEISIVAVVLSVVMAAVAVFELSNRQLLQQTAAVGRAQEQAHHALERVLQELDGASITSLVPDPTGALGCEELVFQRSAGVDGSGAIVWSTRTRIALAPDDGETLDGIDNNHDGVVDELKLTVTHDYGTGSARTVTLAHHVAALFPGETANGHDDNGNGITDEKGFNAQRVGSLLNVRLAIQARGPDGAWVTWPETAALRLRN